MTDGSHEVLQSFRTASVGSNRRFGLTVGALFALLSVLPLALHGQSIRVWMLGPGAILFALGALKPSSLAPFNRLWFRLGLLLGRVTNPIVMGVLFFGAIVPLGWFLRRRRHDLLRLKLDRAADSYWIFRDEPASSLKKQF